MSSGNDPNDLPDYIQNGFIIESHGTVWLLYCRHCKRRCCLRKGDLHPPLMAEIFAHLQQHETIEHSPATGA